MDKSSENIPAIVINNTLDEYNEHNEPRNSYEAPMTPGTPKEFHGMYDWFESVGKGRYSVVKRAEHVITKDSVAVKIIDKVDKSEGELKCIQNEIKALKTMDNSHIIRLYQIIETPAKIYLILEYGEGGDLYEHMTANGSLTENRARHIFEQILTAVAYCHEHNITHRDLKAENILFTDLHARIVKLSDFGFCTEFKKDEMLQTMCGSLAYSAPEVLLQEPYNGAATDMWSLGVILFLLVTGDLPFDAQNEAEVVTRIMDLDFEIPEHVSKECRNLIESLIKSDPTERLTSANALTHHWVATRNLTCPTSPTPKTKHQHQTQQPKKGSLMVKRPSNDISLDSAPSSTKLGRRATLVPRRPNDIKDHEKAKAVAEMIVGGLAQSDIEAALEKNEYDFITSTFYLLLEQEHRKRRGSKRRSGIMKSKKERTSTPSTTKEEIEPDDTQPQPDSVSNQPGQQEQVKQDLPTPSIVIDNGDALNHEPSNAINLTEDIPMQETSKQRKIREKSEIKSQRLSVKKRKQEEKDSEKEKKRQQKLAKQADKEAKKLQTEAKKKAKKAKSIKQ